MKINRINIKKDYRRWLSRMFNFMEWSDIPSYSWEEWTFRLLAKNPTVMTVLSLDKPIPMELAEKWKSEYGEWEHKTGKKHNLLGMAFGYWMKETKNIVIELSDSPDFYGEFPIDQNKIIGDIGKATFPALLNGLRQLTFHNLWISVLDEKTQVIIEFFFSIEDLLNPPWTFYNSPNNDNEIFSQIKKVYYCPLCQKWSITKSSIDKLFKFYKKNITDETDHKFNKVNQIPLF